VLDLACGWGRHALAAAQLGARVVALDRNAAALRALVSTAKGRSWPVSGVRTDLEIKSGIPIKSNSFGAILVFRFLFRPLVPALKEALRPGGLLLYETFTEAQRELQSGPKNPAFLLASGELQTLFSSLDLLAYEEGLTTGEPVEALARLAARRPG